MRIGIDISQIVYEGTGVATYVRKMVDALFALGSKNVYILFGSSLRKRSKLYEFAGSIQKKYPNVIVKIFPFPSTLLDILWNKLHIVPIEWFIGDVDVFWSSDWTQPPLARAHGITTIHDVGFLRYPETFAQTIIDVQKRRLAWVKRECKAILCDSESTKRDIIEYYHAESTKLHVIYPGFTL